MEIAEAKGLVAHLGEHPSLVRGVDVAVVVVDDRADPDSRRRGQIDVAGIVVRQHLLEDDRRVLLDHWYPRPVQLEDVVESLLVEREPALDVVGGVALRLDREAVGRKGSEEDARQSLLDVGVDDLPDPSEARPRRRHQGRDSIDAERLADSSGCRRRASSQLFRPGRGRFLLWRSAGPSSEVEM